MFSPSPGNIARTLRDCLYCLPPAQTPARPPLLLRSRLGHGPCVANDDDDDDAPHPGNAGGANNKPADSDSVQQKIDSVHYSALVLGGVFTSRIFWVVLGLFGVCCGSRNFPLFDVMHAGRAI